MRGRGIVNRPHRNDVSLHLVIDLVPELIRMLEEDELVTELGGLTVARAPVPASGVVSLGHQMLLVGEAMAALGSL